MLAKKAQCDRKKFLWVEDETQQRDNYVAQLRAKSIDVLPAATMEEAIDLVKKNHDEIFCAVIEIGIPVDDQRHVSTELAYRTLGGRRTGLVLGEWIRGRYPEIRLVGYSGGSDHKVIDWFQIVGDGYLVKGSDISPENAFEVVEATLQSKRDDLYRPFVVHGHDRQELDALVDYIQNDLKLARPVVLKEEPAGGVVNIFQKLESHARLRSLAFVLLTPDDVGRPVSEQLVSAYRARQNVIFELGYFLGGRKGEQRRLIVLKKEPLELPSDIEGLILIDITDGIRSADDKIRRELRAMGILPREEDAA